MDSRRARGLAATVERLPAVTQDTNGSTAAGLPATAAESVTVPPAAPVRQPPDELSRGWALLLAVGWPLAMAFAVALEPSPAEPHGAVPLWIVAAGWVVTVAAFVMIGAAIFRHRLAAMAGVVVGGVELALSATCPLSGHHTWGLWWVAQFGILSAMLVATLVALHSTRTPSPSSSTS